MIATFRAVCRRAYWTEENGRRKERHTCRGLEFVGAEGAAALADHLREVHGGPEPLDVAPAWTRIKPVPFKAPRPTAGGLDKVAEKIAAGGYTFPRGAYRFAPPPYAGEPAAVYVCLSDETDAA